MFIATLSNFFLQEEAEAVFETNKDSVIFNVHVGTYLFDFLSSHQNHLRLFQTSSRLVNIVQDYSLVLFLFISGLIMAFQPTITNFQHSF